MTPSEAISHDSTLERLAPWLLSGLLVAGAALRIRPWLSGRSLWIDEAMLALNIIERDYVELAMPLAYRQMAAPGFLWLEKLSVQAFGGGELALRAPALVSGLLLLVAVAWVGWRAFGPLAALVALCLVACSDHLVYFANEVKPYGMDACLATAWFAAVRPWEGVESIWSARRRAAIACLAILYATFSLTSVFVIAGCGLARAVGQLLKQGRRDCAVDLAVLSPAAIVYLLQVLRIQTNAEDQLVDPFWNAYFLPIPPTSLGELRDVAVQYFKLFESGLGVWLKGLAGFLFAFGALVLAGTRRGLAAAFLLPLGLVVVANAFGGYPTAPRLLTFLYPLLALVLAAGVQELALRIQGVRFAAATLVAILLAFPLLGGLTLFERSWAREDVRPLLAELAGLRRPGDIVYVYYGAQYAYAYYAGRFQLPLDEPLDRYVLPVGAPAARAAIPEHAEMTISIPARDQPDLYRVDLERLRGRSRVWVVMSHVWPKAHEGVLGAEMDRLGHRFYESNTPGAVLWGYDLTPDAL